VAYAELVRPYTINNLRKQFDLQVREFNELFVSKIQYIN
jgi:hypothetical protein